MRGAGRHRSHPAFDIAVRTGVRIFSGIGKARRCHCFTPCSWPYRSQCSHAPVGRRRLVFSQPLPQKVERLFLFSSTGGIRSNSKSQSGCFSEFEGEKAARFRAAREFSIIVSQSTAGMSAGVTYLPLQRLRACLITRLDVLTATLIRSRRPKTGERGSR